MRTLWVTPMAFLVACGPGGKGASPDAGNIAIMNGSDAGDARRRVGVRPCGRDRPPDASGAPTAAQLLALVQTCRSVVSSHAYATDEGAAENVDICALNGAVIWKADMDIDCDGTGRRRRQVPRGRLLLPAPDRVHDQGGELPRRVRHPLRRHPHRLPADGPRRRRRRRRDLRRQGQYAVFGDTGPSNIIGEASYACAAALGIDPDPATGGTDGPVTYIAFLGSGAIPADIEDQTATRTLGESLAAELLRAN